MDLSIVVVNFRTFELTCNCIESIIINLKAGIQFEIIVVDNASQEDDEIAFKEIFPIIYIRSKENIGFGPANNLGIAKANGKYLLLINSDTIVFDDSLQKCYEFMESEEAKNIGLLGCKLLNRDRSYQPSFFPFKKNTLINYLLGNNILLFKLFNIGKKYQPQDQVIEVGDVSGAFMFMRKEVVEKVGAFDPDFFLYCEETEWCRERIAKKFRIVYYPFAQIIHFGGKSAPKDLMYIQSKLSQALMWYKKGWVNYLSYIFLSFCNILANFLLFPFVNREVKDCIKKDMRAFIEIIPYLFKDVPKYELKRGSRKIPLIYKQAKAVFSTVN